MDLDERHRMLDALRTSQPIFRDENSKTFVLSRYADIRALLTDPGMLRNADLAEEGSLVRSFKPADMNRPGDRDAGMGWLDAPDHARVRGPIQLALNRRVAALRPAVEAIVAARLDALGNRFDAVEDFAVPIPIAVIGKLLGVDTGDMDRFRAWSEAAIGVFAPNPTVQERAATKAASEAISDYLDVSMALRRKAPRDDLVSDLIAAQAEGVPLSDAEIRVNCMNLLLGGNVTTADLIASAIWLLLAHPDQLARLRSDPALIGGMVEEVLRLVPPGEGTQRIAPRDMTIAGCPVHKSQVVAGLVDSANRDPGIFPDPHRFDIGRRGAAHLSFGGGAHVCIGQHLARLEAQVAVGSIVARFPELRLAEPDARPVWREVPFFRGLATLPVLR
ncbi:MAG: cytochrome P450 [Proteobacteria bacterium]|nr:cytochrome P450 [Pseudomonadota bacterium]